MSDNMKNLFKAIVGILDKFVKKDCPVKDEQVDVPIIEEVRIEPKLTVSDKEPTGGEDRDVWIKYEGVE